MSEKNRTALLIRCSVEEAQQVRKRAAAEHRTVSGYLLNILARRLKLDAALADMLGKGARLAPMDAARADAQTRPRTALLLRCSNAEATGIRAAARRRGTTINAFVLHAHRIALNAQQGIGVDRGIGRASLGRC